MTLKKRPKKSKKPRNFYEAAIAAKAPKGEYVTAREMLDDLPAIVMSNYGEVGARTVDGLVTLHKNDDVWRRRDSGWITWRASGAATELQRNSNLSPDLKSRFELLVFVAWLYDAVSSPNVWKSRQYVAR